MVTAKQIRPFFAVAKSRFQSALAASPPQLPQITQGLEAQSQVAPCGTLGILNLVLWAP